MTTVTEDVAAMPPEAKRKEIPLLVTWLLLGAKIHKKYRGGDGYALELDGEFRPVSDSDLSLIVKVKGELDHGFNAIMPSGKRIVEAYRLASALVEKAVAEPSSACRIAMLKDKGGAGYWRMVLPARHIGAGTNSVNIDVTGAGMKFEWLLEYDTVFVQRLMGWHDFYTLQKLKDAGKRIVYDMDDDIFSLTPDNPAFHVVTRDNQSAAVAIMRLADCVTTTTNVLQDRIRQVTGNVMPVVIPNSLDVYDRWLPTNQVGSPDKWRRIYWQGSATHEKDWEVCIEAVDAVMKKHDDVRLVLLGYLPRCVMANLGKPHWHQRIEHVGFNDPETYFEMIHHVRADVAIAPLFPASFNEAKSPIKWLEATCVGIPVVASAMEPYSSVISDGHDGFLASSSDQWFRLIDGVLEMKLSERREIVSRARGRAVRFDIGKAARSWLEVLFPQEPK